MPAKIADDHRQEHELRVFDLRKLFRDARGEDCSANLSDAGRVLAAVSSAGAPQLAAEARDVLFEAHAFAFDTALTDLPLTFDQADIVSGMKAYRTLIEFWSETSAERRTWGGAIADARDRARIFQNLTYSGVLEQQIQRRAGKRRAAVVDSLRGLGQSFPQAGRAR